MCHSSSTGLIDASRQHSSYPFEELAKIRRDLYLCVCSGLPLSSPFSHYPSVTLNRIPNLKISHEQAALLSHIFKRLLQADLPAIAALGSLQACETLRQVGKG